MKNYRQLILIFLLIIFTTIATNSFLFHHEMEKYYVTIEQNFDMEYRKIAVETLSTLRGRLIEVKELISTDAPTEIVVGRLDDIVDFPLNGNPYLSEFQFEITGSYGTKKKL